MHRHFGLTRYYLYQTVMLACYKLVEVFISFNYHGFYFGFMVHVPIFRNTKLITNSNISKCNSEKTVIWPFSRNSRRWHSLLIIFIELTLFYEFQIQSWRVLHWVIEISPKYTKKVHRTSLWTFFFSDPPVARSQDPNIKSVVLYQLS